MRGPLAAAGVESFDALVFADVAFSIHFDGSPLPNAHAAFDVTADGHADLVVGRDRSFFFVLGPLADPVSQLKLSRAVFSPDGKWIVTTRSHGSTGDPNPGQLVLHSAQSGEIVAEAEILLRPTKSKRYALRAAIPRSQWCSAAA